MNVDEDVSWYLDSELIYLLINDVIVNALRYGTSRIAIQASIADDYLSIKIEDDGNGYPEETNAPYGIAKKALMQLVQSYNGYVFG